MKPLNIIQQFRSANDIDNGFYIISLLFITICYLYFIVDILGDYLAIKFDEIVFDKLMKRFDTDLPVEKLVSIQKMRGL